jgi:peptide/nickel transport system permease protein
MPSQTSFIAPSIRAFVLANVIRRNPSLAIGGLLLALLMLVAIIGPLVLRVSPLAIDLSRVLAQPSRSNWLGCDSLGRDQLSRIVWGARLSLGVSTVVVALSLTVGGLIGGAAALAGGRIDALIMRAVDIVMAFPGFLLALALAAILGPGLLDLVIALTAMGWTGYARMVRGEVLSLREREYIEAARVLGATPRRLLFCHLMPGLAGPLAVQATFGVGGIIIAEAALSFLGLGARPPTPSWGNMLDAGRAFILVAPVLTTAPGVAIGLSVLGFNLLGDGLAQLIGHRR